jgi:hypothetical protein
MATAEFHKPKAVRMTLVALLTLSFALTGYWLASDRPVAGQSQAPDAGSEHLERFIGIHSGIPQDAYFNRADDLKLDRLSRENRALREGRLSGLSPTIKDKGLLVSGSKHDHIMTGYDTVGFVPALPVKLAKIICIGTLIDSHGFVGDDHRSAYTEFTFDVEKILKTDNPEIADGGKVTGMRMGARIHFPSGHITDYLIEGKGIPRAGSRYVLFLWRPDGSTLDDYGITTAYEVSGGQIFALDQARPFTQYEGASESDFMSALSHELQANGNAQ